MGFCGLGVSGSFVGTGETFDETVCTEFDGTCVVFDVCSIEFFGRFVVVVSFDGLVSTVSTVSTVVTGFTVFMSSTFSDFSDFSSFSSFSSFSDSRSTSGRCTVGWLEGVRCSLEVWILLCVWSDVEFNSEEKDELDGALLERDAVEGPLGVERIVCLDKKVVDVDACGNVS